MTQHHCHAIGCKAACPPAMLMCRPCWNKVPGEYQREVYRTVKLRGESADQTWAEWWRAAALAIASVQAKRDPQWDRQAYIDREFSTADQLERRGDRE
jgi:hypothetical protein